MKNNKIIVRIETEVKEKLKEILKKEDMTLSKFLRQHIELKLSS